MTRIEPTTSLKGIYVLFLRSIGMTLEQEKDDLKAKLINLGYFKTPDGRQLYELS